MRLTDGFEIREYFDPSKIIGHGYRSVDVEELLAHARALEDMLKKHQWDSFNDDGHFYCSECFGSQPTHGPDCELAKLLGEG